MAERAHAASIDVATGPPRANAPGDPLCLRLRQVILALAILCHPVPVLHAQPETAGQQQSAATEESRLGQDLESPMQRSGRRGPAVLKAFRKFATYYRSSVGAAVQTGIIRLNTPGQRTKGIRTFETAYARRQATSGSNHLQTAVAGQSQNIAGREQRFGLAVRDD